jgi:prophage DNA circulation protein
MGQAQLLTSLGSIGGVANAASNLANALTGGSPSAWQHAIRQASFKGVPFGVWTGETAFGRRTATHRYPQRDSVWVEDLGREARLYHLHAFLLEDDAIYHGGPVGMQRTAFMNVFEKAGVGELIHPTLGSLQVAGLQAQCHEKWDAGRYFELSLTFIESGPQVIIMGASPGSLLTKALDAVGLSSLNGFISEAADLVQYGSAIVLANINTALQWYSEAVGLVHDVKRFFGSVSTLVNSVENIFESSNTTSGVIGSSYGRYFGGGNIGYSASRLTRTAPTTIAQLIANDAAARTAVNQAGAALTKAAANPADAATYSAAVQGLASAVAASAADPADRLRLITTLATPLPMAPTTPSEVGNAIASMQTAATHLFTRAALGELAAASGAYQPTSQDDAATVSDEVTQALDAAIIDAGNTGADDVYSALQATKNAVVLDLKARGGALAPIVPYHFNASLPALALAQRIYRDGGRSDDLVKQVDPVHPAFMPSDFMALAS